jgi:hypothetical protein
MERSDYSKGRETDSSGDKVGSPIRSKMPHSAPESAHNLSAVD